MVALLLIALGASACTSSHHATGATPGPASSTAGGTSSGLPTFTPAPIHWGTCPSDVTVSGAVCGDLTVPLDYSHPGGAKIQLAVSMIKHTASAHSYQGALVLNPGGPGEGGLRMVTTSRQVPSALAADYDWVGFDPRGVDHSKPALSCQADYFAGPRPPYAPDTVARLKAWTTRAAAYAAACGRHGGDLLDHLSTVDNARDLDSLREALGHKQISYYGYSYGTQIGQVYATLFPTHLRRLVLDSNVDPRYDDYTSNLHQDVAFNANMKIWFGWLARYDSVYQLGSTEKAVAALYQRQQTALDAHPGGAVGGDEWIDVFTQAAYYQDGWTVLGSAFARWVHEHDITLLTSLYQQIDRPQDDNATAIYNATECTDTTWPTSMTDYVAVNRRLAKTAPAITWENAWLNAPCLTWPAAPHAPVTIDGSKVTSALLVDQTLDAATPYAGSLATRAVFPHSALLALPGGTSHADSLSGDVCEDTIIERYLASGSLPARRSGNRADVTCDPPPQPIPARQ